MHPNLSFEQAPPISVPFRFFITAPLFGVAAGLLLAWQGGAGLASRWGAEVLALTHLFSVGFMLQAMCGALLQFVPVATGGNVWRPRLIANIVHPLITLAAVALVTAFAWPSIDMLQFAVPLFVAGLSVFVVAVGTAVLRTPAKGMTIHVLRMALAGLAVTLTLGLLLATLLGWQIAPENVARWSLQTLVNVHAAWGLGGWALLLVMGVSYLVVPMFQLTPAYPAHASRWLPTTLFGVLLCWSLQLVSPALLAGPIQNGVVMLGLLVAALYAGITLWLQKRRRRRVTDVTFHFWRSAMIALLAVAASWLAFLAFPDLAAHPRAPLWLGVLVLPGVFVSVINGTLYKIVPFLIWLHLQNLGNLKTLPPNMKQMISERMMRGQFACHLVALALLLATVIWPPLAVPAGLALAASFLWLEWNLVKALRLYVDFRTRTLQALGTAPVKDRTDATGVRRVS